VRFADMAQAGRNPGRIIPWVLMEFARNHPGRRVWIIGEPIWPARSEVEYPACAAHEALTNVAFTGRDAAILCPYDVAGLNEQRVSDSWRTHPVMADADRSWVSDRYADPVDVAASFNQPLPAPPATAQRLSFARLPDLAALRALVTWHATESRLPLARTVDLLLAVQELAVNTIEHANIGDGTLMVWSEPGMVICQIEDRGHITDPMAGCRRPENRFQRGQGLVRVNRLVDFLRCHTDFSGTAFRLHMHLPTHP
jgi:anti-sigma regulatory factor (Ser/Thr protein kinase)